MLEKNQSQRKMQIVDFLDIDTSKITFQKPKPNKYNGSQIGILYNGARMFVKYDGITPFGLKENYDKDGKYLGTSMQINCEGEYLEKAKELDNFFMNAFYENKWNINKNIPLQHIMGYDEHGQGGLWKRLCKASYKLNKETDEREYLNYPTKMEFSLLYKNETIQTNIFNWQGEKLPCETNIDPYSRVKFIAGWFSLTRGTFGLTLKPKLMQVKFKKENNQFEFCILDEDDDEDDEDDEDFLLE